MGTFSIDELRKSVKPDEMSETVTIPSQSEKLTRTKTTMGQAPKFQNHRPKDETQTLIKAMLKEANKPCTFREIARAIDRSPSPHLRNLIVEMVTAGDLLEAVDMHPNQRMVRFWYSLPTSN